MRAENLKLGVLYVFLASVAYACMGVLVKFGTSKVTNEQMVFMRNFVCLVLLMPWIFLPKTKSLRTPVIGIHLIRGIAGLLNMYLFFYSIRYILLADAVLLNNTMPLFVPFVLWIWTGKKISWKLLPGLLLGFIGIIMVLQPGITIFQPAALMALGSGVFMSISMSGIRELGNTEPTYRILFYYFAIASFFSFFPLFWAWENPSLYVWLILIGIGITAAIYQLLLTQGYQSANASKVSPIIYTAVILSAFFDWLIWDAKPHLLTYFGIILVCIGAILTLRSEA